MEESTLLVEVTNQLDLSQLIQQQRDIIDQQQSIIQQLTDTNVFLGFISTILFVAFIYFSITKFLNFVIGNGLFFHGRRF
jgi:hypothetical protein